MDNATDDALMLPKRVEQVGRAKPFLVLVAMSPSTTMAAFRLLSYATCMWSFLYAKILKTGRPPSRGRGEHPRTAFHPVPCSSDIGELDQLPLAPAGENQKARFRSTKTTGYRPRFRTLSRRGACKCTILNRIVHLGTSTTVAIA